MSDLLPTLSVVALKVPHNEAPASLPAPAIDLPLATPKHTTPSLRVLPHLHTFAYVVSAFLRTLFSHFIPSSPIKCQDPGQTSGEISFVSHPSLFQSFS